MIHVAAKEMGLHTQNTPSVSDGSGYTAMEEDVREEHTRPYKLFWSNFEQTRSNSPNFSGQLAPDWSPICWLVSNLWSFPPLALSCPKTWFPYPVIFSPKWGKSEAWATWSQQKIAKLSELEPGLNCLEPGLNWVKWSTNYRTKSEPAHYWTKSEPRKRVPNRSAAVHIVTNLEPIFLLYKSIKLEPKSAFVQNVSNLP